MRHEQATSGGWRAAVTWSEPTPEEKALKIELDRNLGGVWPSVILLMTATPALGTAIHVGAAGVSEEVVEGAHGLKYRRGIDPHSVTAILIGAAAGLGKQHGVEIRIDSGGVSTDTAEGICRFAAELAATLITAEGSPALEEALAGCVLNWV